MAEEKAVSSFIRRTVSAVVLIPLALGVVYVGGWLMAAVIVAIAGVMTYEWSMMTQKTASLLNLAAVIVPLAGVAAAILTGHDPWALLGIAAAATLAAIVGAVQHRPVLWPALGAIYVTVPAAAIIWLRQETFGFERTVALFLVVWATDIGAYVAGMLVGGPKLAPRISPKKTWSGLIGGMIAAALTLTATGWAFGLGAEAWLLLIGALAALWGQIGDLTESALKRRFGVKDSGAIIPGHGGFLDRVDGLVFVAPAAALVVAVW